MKRPWRCCLCPARGVGRDEAANLAAFYRHYVSVHMERVS